MRQIRWLWLLLQLAAVYPQQGGVSGVLEDRRTREGLPGTKLGLSGYKAVAEAGSGGEFQLDGVPPGNYILEIAAQNYQSKKIPIEIAATVMLDLGTVFLDREIELETPESFVNLQEAELSDEGAGHSGFGLLMANRDVFLKRAAFDWSPAFYRPRGYDGRTSQVLLNGFPMNGLYDGRPQWNHWGGLNDVSRNQELFYGLSFSDYGTDAMLGGVAIDTRPSKMRPGNRLSGSVSNRTYGGRLMATYVSRPGEKGFSYALSASRRWANEGYIQGTLYDAWSAYVSLDYQLDDHNSLHVAAIVASNRRGRSAALSDEVAELLGRDYNPYWGFQSGRIRNSRERKIKEPLVQLYYLYQRQKSHIQLGMSYQFGSLQGSRMGYYHAPNPDPVYYRYLPSYSINNPGATNFINAEIARMALLKNPQIRWEELYMANTGAGLEGKAAYLLYDDVSQNNQWTMLATTNLDLGERIRIDAGLHFRKLHTDNYAQIADLLGAAYHEDRDPFSSTLNDINGNQEKEEGDKFGYHYTTTASSLHSYLQFRYSFHNWELGALATYTNTSYQRKGIFVNERFPENSGGIGPIKDFGTWVFKGSLSYHAGNTHWWYLYGIHGHRAPLLKQLYVNPRESHSVVPGPELESQDGLELDYFLRMPDVSVKLGTFYSRMMHQADIRFFFVDAGVGSDFVQEVVTGLDHLYMGAELGVEYNLTTSLKGSIATSLGRYQYASDPLVSINFDTAGPEDDLINQEGQLALGPASLKSYYLPAGPQWAFSAGLDYQAASYWRVGITANYLGRTYISPSALARTASFSLNPDTGLPFPEATPDRLHQLLRQTPLEDIYLLNLNAGKSWLYKGVYLGLFFSVTNLFDLDFRTGGYEQSRNGNFGQWLRDHRSGNPSFGPKYWHGYGRTYFLNLSVSF